MKLFDTTKKKVVAGATGFVLVAGGGAATYAGTDIGAQIQNWYQNQFDSEVAEGAEDVADYGEKEGEIALKDYDQLKTDAGDSIDVAKESETHLAKGDISDEKEKRIANLEGKKSEIEDSMGGQFDDLFAQGKEVLNDIKDEAKSKAEEDLRNKIENDTDDAVENVNAELDQKTDQAVEDLETAIAKSKEDLSDELDEESEKTAEDLKDVIDESIIDVQSATEELSEKLLNESRMTIQEAAHQKVDEAKDSLDQVVTEMNN